MYDIIELNGLLLNELKEIAKALNIEDYKGLKKQDLIYKILEIQPQPTEVVVVLDEEPVAKKKPVRKTKEDALVTRNSAA